MVTPKTTKKTPTVRKPRAPKSDAAQVEHADPKPLQEHSKELSSEPVATQAPASDNKTRGRYFFAVGRRKTAIANVRLFHGQLKNLVNNIEIEKYFGNSSYINQAIKPMQLTGTETQYYFLANIRGGGINAQSQALAHGIARAIVVSNLEHRRVLKKNGMLTRDSRKKERKKPGLKRARRGPQWAKR